VKDPLFAMQNQEIIERITALAEPVAEQLGLELVAVAYQTHTRPATLRVDIRNLSEQTGLDDCARMSRALEAVLELDDPITSAYTLEISSPGVERNLTTDREFTAFRGFAVLVKADEPIDGKLQWEGQLIARDEEHVHLSLQGRRIALPRAQVSLVQLTRVGKKTT
jgi:ribosome maturation factor RimP